MLEVLTSDELRNAATALAAITALLVFVVNSLAQRRNQRIENLSRFFDVHDRLMAREGFLMRHLHEIQAGASLRNSDDPHEEAEFHLLLLQIEQLAILTLNDAVTRSTQLYMLGMYAGPLSEMLNDRERNNPFWALAVDYLRQLADMARELDGTPIDLVKRHRH